jgi:hypothetical protein
MNDLSNRQLRTDIDMQVVARDGDVHLLFSEKDQKGDKVAAYTSNFLLSASDALKFSTLLADLAFEADTGLKAAGPALKSELVDRHRKTLINRISTMLNSQRENRLLTNNGLAKQLVDVMLSEVFS